MRKVGAAADAGPTEAASHGAIWHPSPNFGARRGPLRPCLIVLHYTAMSSAEAALERLCDPAHAVSAHFLVGRRGALWQLVAEGARAWHAGAGAWGPFDDVNSAAIGIEIDNDGRSPFSEPAMARLERLLADLMDRHRIGPAGVIGHADCAPGRKTDPGPRFYWPRLARRGLAMAGPGPVASHEADPPAPGPLPDLEVDAALRRVGWTADAPLRDRLAAFRARFRPGASGPPAPADMRALAALPAAALDPPPGAA